MDCVYELNMYFFLSNMLHLLLYEYGSIKYVDIFIITIFE